MIVSSWQELAAKHKISDWELPRVIVIDSMQWTVENGEYPQIFKQRITSAYREFVFIYELQYCTSYDLCQASYLIFFK